MKTDNDCGLINFSDKVILKSESEKTRFLMLNNEFIACVISVFLVKGQVERFHQCEKVGNYLLKEQQMSTWSLWKEISST